MNNQASNIWQIDRFQNLYLEPSRNGVYKRKSFHGRGQKIVNMGELFAFEFISDQEMKRVALDDKELEKDLLEDGDLLFARRSLVFEGSGKCSIIVNPDEPLTFESSIIRARLNKKIADPMFFYYFFKSPQGRATMASIAAQTNVSGITGNNLSQLMVPVPSILIQKQIASIVYTFDKKIEVNNKVMKTLEKVTQTIFNEWFIKFKFPGNEKSELLENVPNGWEIRNFGDICQTYGGGTPSTYNQEYWDQGDIFWATPTDMTPLNGPFIYGTAKKITEKGLRNSSSKLLPSGSILMTSRATIGLIAISKEPICTNQGFISIVSNGSPSNYFLYCLLKSHLKEVKSLATGSTFPEISRGVFRNIKVTLPDEDIMNKFDEFVNPLFEQISNILQENQKMIILRDLLLSKFMKGEISV